MGASQGMVGLCCRHICHYLLILQLTDKFDGVAAPELSCRDAAPGRDHGTGRELGAGFDKRAFGDDAPDPDECFVLDGG